MGEKGRAWVERDWNWDLIASRLRALIDGREAAFRVTADACHRHAARAGRDSAVA